MTTLPAGWKLRLACPFCGSNCLFTEPDEYGSGGQWVSPIHVGCNDCKAEQVGDTEEEAVSRWNARATPPASAQDAITVSLDPDPRGVSVGVWQGSRCIYSGAHPIPTGATGEDGRSATYGMTLAERIAHVGGRTNAQSYTEFGSPMAVNALIQHVLRDLDWTRQDDDGAYQARYRLPDGEWSSWGHVVCGVKGHEQELRYLPGERRPAPAAGDALDRDQQRLALWQAIRDITIGNLHDDKLILANLHKAGYVIALAAMYPNSSKPRPHSAPVADTLPLEKALYELVDKIAPGLDTGDLVQDARRSSTLLDAIMASAPVTGEAAYYAVLHGKALFGVFDTEAAADECISRAIYPSVMSIHPLYAAPQASEAVRTHVLAALESAQRFIRNGIEFGYIRMPDADTPDPAHRTPGLIDAAIRSLKSQADKDGGQQRAGDEKEPQ